MIRSLKKLNFRLYFALLLLGLAPAVYTTVRIFFLGSLPGEWAYSIAGQLDWLNLLYEIIDEAILLPLFYFMGKAAQDRGEFSNRVRSGLLVTMCLYTALSLTVILFAKNLLGLMAAGIDILEASAAYIRIESVAKIFGVLGSFTLITLVTLNRERYLYILTAIRLGLSILADTFLVSSLPFSLHLGVNGIGYSNILVNGLLLAVSIALLSKEGVYIFSGAGLSFKWMKELLVVGGMSGLESFVRNISYMLMIVRMVNVVSEQGTYWVANSFIWGWLLLPVIQLGELIKQEISTSRDAVSTHTYGYFGITAFICAFWFFSVPFWKPFMTYALGYTDTDALFRLVILLVGFYVLFSFQNIFDATFYALGRTDYMLFESVAANIIYYGCVFFLYRAGIWTPTLTSIALMFGGGIAFDSLVSLAANCHLLKKQNIQLRRP